MPSISGSCNCGQITVKLDKKPDSNCFCHCTDCQRSSGAPMSGNFIVSKDEFHIEGPVKRWAGKGVSGKAVERYFCPDCGCSTHSILEVMGGAVVVKSGLFSESKDIPVGMELFTKDRYGAIQAVEGADQKEAMP